MKSEDFQHLLRHDLSSFIQFAFGVLHPGAPYHHNWHIDVMAHVLTQVDQGHIKRLIINMPPRMLKSHCASIAFPAWLLGRNPYKRLLYLHGSKILGRELEDGCLDLMHSRRYRALFRGVHIIEEKDRFKTSFGGRRQYMPIMSRLTGLGADIIVIDDPLSTSDAREEGARRRLHQQFDENILQRLDNKKNGAIVLVMQRLHEHDLTAHLLAKDEGWVHVNMPAIAMQDEIWQLPYNNSHTRLKGQPLHPVREDQEQLIDILLSIGGYAFAHQYLQGSYKPYFGEEGHGCLWLTPQQEGIFWDARTSAGRPHGAHHFRESDLILPKVFGSGSDPYPPDMRHQLTMEEWQIGAAITREKMFERERRIKAGELEF